MRLTRIEVESFRGYNRAQSFDCFADTIILEGPNGSGKTSFFDAINWGLFGSVARLRGSRDVVGDAHIHNYFSDDPDARVSLHLEIGGRSALITRQKSHLLVVDDGAEIPASDADGWIADQFKPATAAETWSPTDAEHRFLSAHLLGQEQVAAFLRGTKPRERFDALASLLGVDLVQRFFSHTAQVDKTGAREEEELARRKQAISHQLERVRLEQEELEAGAGNNGSASTLERLLEEITILAARAGDEGTSIFLPAPDGLVVADIVAAAQELRAAVTSLVEAARARASVLQQIETSLPDALARQTKRLEIEGALVQLRSAAEASEAILMEVTTERDTVGRRLLEVRAAVDAARATADEYAAFLLSAEAFVNGERCPVCELHIAPEETRARLRKRAQEIPASLRALERERRELEAQERDLEERMAEPRGALDAARDSITALKTEREGLDKAEAAWESLLLAAGAHGVEDVGDAPFQRQLEATRQQALYELTVEIDALLAKARYLASKDRRSALAGDEARLRAEDAVVSEALEQVKRGRHLIQSITSAAKRSEREIVRRLVLDQEPLLNALYQRLRPHPVLDQLEIDFGQFDERGEVYFRAIAGEKRPNVSAIFSSAQLNAVAICVFLATNVSSGDGRFALLDDPIQNMDDFNVLGLLDLLRAASTNRQIVVSTHDVQLGELMRRKLRPLQATQKTIIHRFTGYDRSGPQVETIVDSFAATPDLLPTLGD